MDGTKEEEMKRIEEDKMSGVPGFDGHLDNNNGLAGLQPAIGIAIAIQQWQLRYVWLRSRLNAGRRGLRQANVPLARQAHTSLDR
jgi:hypothetical protein